MFTPQIKFSVIFSYVAFVLLGCGDGKPRVYPTTGRMLFNGEPMPLGASVTFLPTGASGIATSGSVDVEGNLSISTFGGKSGLVPGEYRVVIYQVTDKEPDQADLDGEIRAAATESFVILKKDQRIPKIYSDRNLSPILITIKEEINDLGTIDLKTDV